LAGRSRSGIKNDVPSTNNSTKVIPARKPPIQTYQQDSHKIIAENWKDMCKAFDSIPNGQSLKTKHHFSKADVI
jgi:hypothetical protein